MFKKPYLLLLPLLLVQVFTAVAQTSSIPQACNSLKSDSVPATWTFAISGDSRNYGDVIVPAIAADVAQYAPEFFWHLGDFRWNTTIDEDMDCNNMLKTPVGSECSLSQNLRARTKVWQDFEASQVESFTVPVVLGIGNHEMVGHWSEADFRQTFRCWLAAPVLQKQRAEDDKSGVRKASLPNTYYHWQLGPVDFINLDNAGNRWTGHDPAFGTEQRTWLMDVLKHDAADPGVKSLVIGMHAALPDSLSPGHSMCESPEGRKTGRLVYDALWNFQNATHKSVYVFASHSHYYLADIYNTPAHQGRVLQGWIIGTAGARRYKLPPGTKGSANARERTYGYLLATVNPDGKRDGTIGFKFQMIEKKHLPATVKARYTSRFIDECFADNFDPVPGTSEQEQLACSDSGPAPRVAAKPR